MHKTPGHVYLLLPPGLEREPRRWDRQEQPVCSPFPELDHPFGFVKKPTAQCSGRAWLTLVDGVLWQLAELAADDPCIGAQEFLLTGGQLQDESAVVR